MITNEIIASFSKCQYKSYLKFKQEIGNKTEYEILEKEILNLYKKNFYAELQRNSRNRILPTFDFQKKFQFTELSYAFETVVQSKEFSINFDALEISPQESSPNKISYIPILVSPKEKVSRLEKISFIANCLILSDLQHITIEFGKLIYGSNLKSTKIKLTTYSKEAQKTLQELKKIVNGENVPRFFQNDHCRICEFQKTCLATLIEKDDLSLLGRISEKEVLKKNSRGIFTVHQLSYTFRPRKNSKKRPQMNQPFLWELKALALREKQTYIKEIPKLPDSEVEIYLDFEGLPEEGFIYLIGLVIKEGETENQLSFWANSKDEEEKIFKQLFDIISGFKEFTLYHYGSYEIQALKKMDKKLKNAYENEIKLIVKSSVNLLALFRSDIYPPTYTNELKDIADFLGFHWSDENASGIQSIVWRKRWELSQDTGYQQHLIQYNIEDCLALKVIKNWLVNIAIKLEQEANTDFYKVEDLKATSYLKFGKTDYQLSDFEKINKCAYFDYQRNKIYLRTNTRLKKVAKRKSTIAKKSNQIDKTVILPIQICPNCKHENVYRLNSPGKVIIDLKFIKNGIIKWVTQIKGNRFICPNCKIRYSTMNLKKVSKYGNNLMAWSMNQYVTYRVGLNKVSNMLQKNFNIIIPNNNIYRFKSVFAKKYKATLTEIMDDIIGGSLIHADETDLKVRGFSSGYVWVFTNMESVFYLFKPTRDAGFLREFLKGFKGVLVSDFYSGYDTLDCHQQKCLIHLIRDLNEDFLKDQFNNELKDIVVEFGRLLRKIIETVDRYGLKKRNLNKHNKNVEKFYREIVSQDYKTEIAAYYQKRFLKNKEKLFTFLNYDGIPWNNNNAEHAIKPFARFRRDADGVLTEKSINEYLILLSIQQTCHYRGISFLEFLKSKEKSIDEYSRKV